MPGCLSQLLTPFYSHTQNISQHSMEIIVKRFFCISGRSNRVVLEAQGFFKWDFSSPYVITAAKLNHVVVVCYCHYLLGWRVGFFAMVIPNTEFLRNHAAVLPMLYSVSASLYRQSFNMAVVKETMSRYLAYQKIWFTFYINTKVF